MGILGAPVLRLGDALGRQVGDLRFDLLQGIESDLAARQFAQQADVAERLNLGHGPVDQVRHLVHLRRPEPPLAQPGRAQANAHRLRRDLIAGDGVPVGHNARQVQDAHGWLAAQGKAGRGLDAVQVQHAKVTVGAAVGQLQATALQPFSQGSGVLLDPPLQPPEGLRLGDLESHAHGGEFLSMGSALLAGKDGHIYAIGQLLIGGHDDSPPRAAERLVGREGDDIGDAHGARESTGDDHARRVADVSQQQGAHLVGDVGKRLPVGRPGVGGKASDDHLGLVLVGQITDLVVIQPAGPPTDAIADDLIALAGKVELAAVGQVTALVEVHAHDHIASLDNSVIDGQVGRRA